MGNGEQLVCEGISRSARRLLDDRGDGCTADTRQLDAWRELRLDVDRSDYDLAIDERCSHRIISCDSGWDEPWSIAHVVRELFITGWRHDERGDIMGDGEQLVREGIGRSARRLLDDRGEHRGLHIFELDAWRELRLDVDRSDHDLAIDERRSHRIISCDSGWDEPWSIAHVVRELFITGWRYDE